MTFAIIAPKAELKGQNFMDTCTCCGNDFTASISDSNGDFGVCPDCDKTSADILNKMVDDTINGVIAKLEKEGGYASQIEKIKSLNQSQKQRLVNKWASR